MHKFFGIASLLSVLLLIAGCDGKGTFPNPATEIGGDSAARVSAVTTILAKQQAPPTTIVDAHFLEEETGDGQFGPSDYHDFTHIKVAPQDVSKWTKTLATLSPKPIYSAPKNPRAWWLKPQNFGALRFYEPVSLTGDDNGWVGVSTTGDIYIYTSTL